MTRQWIYPPRKTKLNMTKSAAVLTIHRAPDMTARGRRDIAKWLQQQANFLLKRHKEMAPRFTTRFIYECE